MRGEEKKLAKIFALTSVGVITILLFCIILGFLIRPTKSEWIVEPEQTNEVSKEDDIDEENVVWVDGAQMFEYSIVENYAEIVGLKSGFSLDKKYIIIPQKIGGYNIAKIKSGIFNGSGVRGVWLRGSDTAIESGAFENCGDLGFVYIGVDENLNSITGIETKIGENAFKNCPKIEELFLGGSVQVVCENCFKGSKSVKKIFVDSDGVFNQIVSIHSLGGAMESREAVIYTGENVSIGNFYLDESGWYKTSFVKIGNTDCVERKLVSPLYVVKFDVGNYDDVVVDGSLEIEYSALDRKINLPTITRPYCTPKFVNVKDNIEVDISKLTPNMACDLNVKVSWSATRYSIVYNLDGGKMTGGTASYSYLGNDIVLKNATKDGYYFAGWYTEPEFVNKIETISKTAGKDYSLYAKFEVYFELDGNKIVGVRDCAMGATEITIPEKVNGVDVKEIADSAFVSCGSLQKLVINAKITSIGARAFENLRSLSSVTFPSSLETIGEYAFSGCYSITGVYVPKGVYSVGAGAFKDCVSLISLSVEDGAYFTDIKASTFENCGNLSILNIPNGIAIVGDRAFYGCRSLSKIAGFWSGLENIGEYAFCGCNNLVISGLNDEILSVGGYAFGDCLGLKQINLSNLLIKCIPAGLFSGCKNLQSVVLPDELEEIESYAFYENISLKDLAIVGDSLGIVGEYAFYGSGLEEIELNNVNCIGGFAFGSCDSLMEVFVNKFSGWQNDDGVIYGLNASSFACLLEDSGCAVVRNELFIYGDKPTTIAGVTGFGLSLDELVVDYDIEVVLAGAFDDVADGVRVVFEDKNLWLNASGDVIDVSNSLLNLDELKCAGEDLFCKKCFVVEDDKIISATDDFALVENLYIPDFITEIGSGAFNGFKNLKYVYMPYTVCAIGQKAFYGCENLAEVEAEEFYNWKWTTNGFEYALPFDQFVGKLKIDSISTFRKDNIFLIRGNKLVSLVSGLKNIETIVVPERVSVICDYAFAGVPVKNVKLPKSAVSIGCYAFSDCAYLTSINLDELDNLQFIGDCAFSGCVKLLGNELLENYYAVVIPESVVCLGEKVFYDCKALIRVDVYASISKLPEKTFYNCASLQNYTLSDSILEIGERAFYCCKSLISFELFNVKTIGLQAFYGCESVTGIDLSGVESVGDCAFCYSKQTKIIIPESLRTIGCGAFYKTGATMVEFEVKDGWIIKQSGSGVELAIDVDVEPARNAHDMIEVYADFVYLR